MSETRSVAVVGASNDRCKYGNKAVRAFRDCGWRVFPVNPNMATVEGLQAYPSVDAIPESLNLVTLYVPAAVGVTLLPAIAAKKPDQLWVNPGAESPELKTEAERLSLQTVFACSIVALGRSPEDYPDR